MATPSLEATEFPVGHCPACDREVLTHLDVGPADEDIRRCLHCDALVTGEVRFVSSDQLEAAGYVAVDAKTCGNGGGCGARGCGIRPGS